ncbi:SNF-related serine/threonine-protein kinase-like [Haliotis cracherodii]|uniref:SNF-related serine/threonine-protein kinase-like n=1 Tax=Haliotis cracherodii TaxID=6455 RepID=UPI0039EB3F5D
MSRMETRKQRGDYDGKIAGLYDLEDTIGRGHFAVVKLARHVFTGEKVAVKVIDKTKLDEISRSHLFQEVRCMKLVQHPNVVRLYEVIDTQTKLYLILELGDGGDMYDYIMKHDGGLEETAARRYFRQIVEAISYCHRLHVVHRDLKPENVVFFEKLGLVKLTDFGFSNMFNPGKKLETSCGSLAYSAPEILLGDSYDAPAVDVWSLGVILYMLVCGCAPFQEANDSETLTMIMDCKFNIPDHISSSCRELIRGMLIREPSRRLTLDQILRHEWVTVGGEYNPVFYMPLISHEHLTAEDHTYVVQRMVEGKIASKDEIVSSLDKDSYDHITATYYLLAERKLKKHQHELQQAASQLRKQSAPGHSQKPHLEPLSLSPRKQREVKKTKTAPIGWGMDADSLSISPTISQPMSADGSLNRPVFVKTLTSSMTLDRKSSQKKRPSKLGSITPGEVGLPSPTEINLLSKSEPDAENMKKSISVSAKFSKIAILSSFFERKAAAAAGKGPTPDHKTGFFLPGGAKKADKVQTEPSDQRDALKPTYVQSLVSPPGTHPSPSASPKHNAASPEKHYRVRKCSLIKEESQDSQEDGSDMDVEEPGMMKPIASCNSLESMVSVSRCQQSSSMLAMSGQTTSQSMSLQQTTSLQVVPQLTVTKQPSVQQTASTGKELGATRWPLKSVNSSPQLLNQIFEENESDEEEDFVPQKLHSPRTFVSSMASPEILRKYEQRKKRRGAGQRGTSCSSSDASDTDDTEGRSRKDKLKHKFVHRRDSSDHSSDTDGPGGHGGNMGGGAHFSGGGGSSRGSQGGNRKDSGKKDNSGNQGSKGQGSQGSKQNQANTSNGAELNLKALTKKLSQLSVNSLSSMSSVGSVGNGNCATSASSTAQWTIGNTPIQYIGRTDSELYVEAKSLQFSELSEYTDHDLGDRSSVCSSDCVLMQRKGHRARSKITTDINSNGVPPSYCKPGGAQQLSVMKVESKCCSVV